MGNFAVNLAQVDSSQSVYSLTRLILVVGKRQQLADRFERKAEIASAAYEGKPGQMVKSV